MKKSIRDKIITVGAFFLTLTLVPVVLSSCSPVMAVKQPDKKNISVFRVGTPRSILLAEFGHPTVTEERDGIRYDVFAFKQGYSKGAKVGRAAFHAAADVVTLGLWEVVGTPMEGAFDGTDMAYEVSYDEDRKVAGVVLLKN